MKRVFHSLVCLVVERSKTSSSALFLIGLFFSANIASAADQYWRTDGTTGGTWTSSYWSIGAPTATGGVGWTNGNNAFFTADSSLTFATATVGNVSVLDNVTVTVSANNTLTLGGIRTFDIGSGATLNWTSQGQSSASGNEGAGVIKSGAGTLNWGAGPGLSNTRFNGGFTVNSGTVIVSGGGSFGVGSVVLNGGTIQSSGSITYLATNLTIGGNLTFSGTGNDQWNQSVNLGSETRVITNTTTSTATRTFSGTISGGSGAGLVFTGAGGSGGIVLNATNTYTGDTIVDSGVVRLGATGSISGSPNIVVSNSALLDVSAAGLTVGVNQALKGAGTIGGAVTNNGTIEPGAAISTMTFSNAPVLNGTVRMKVDQTSAPKSDKLHVVNGTLNYGGTLVITNVVVGLTNGTFTLFSAGSYAGGFSDLVLPGGINHWSTNRLAVDGTIVFTNRSPTALTNNIGVTPGITQSLQIVGGKHAPTDPESDALVITNVIQGAFGIVGFDSSNVTYTATGSGVTDSFYYVLADNYGGSSTGVVNVAVGTAGAGYNRLGDPVNLGGNDYQLTYVGIPGLNYALDWSGDLSTWVPQVTNMVGTNGFLIFTNHQEGSPNFWRTRFVITP